MLLMLVVKGFNFDNGAFDVGGAMAFAPCAIILRFWLNLHKWPLCSSRSEMWLYLPRSVGKDHIVTTTIKYCRPGITKM